ncbi:MAG: hypothetical protein Q7S74_04025 [Nanoarchaeota archaeon]|nr:hypothetical protein [Nanoarchaeota archaeon]
MGIELNPTFNENQLLYTRVLTNIAKYRTGAIEKESIDLQHTLDVNYNHGRHLTAEEQIQRQQILDNIHTLDERALLIRRELAPEEGPYTATHRY